MSQRFTLSLATLMVALAAGTTAQSAAGADERQRGAPRAEERQRGAPRADHRAPVAPPGRWLDRGHGHGQHYPVTGYRVRHLHPGAHFTVWGGVRYGYHGGVWYAPYGGGGYVVARPPFGVFVTDLPTLRTVVTIGGIAYLYANGVYYRDRAEGGYEVVPSPIVGHGDGSTARNYVYPRQSQSAEVQASDEYECHRWAVDQTGFDPSAAASGQGSGAGRRGDYTRAQTACLEGRGYTVR